MKVLVADDEPVSRRILEKAVGALGHEVVAVEDGLAAWAALERAHYPVLVSDWMMPAVDGIDLIRRLRAAGRRKYTYVVLLTTLGGNENHLAAMDAGADDFLVKPLDTQQLRVRLRVAERILALQEEVRQLTGLLPMCSYCRKIRDKAGEWTTLERYVAEQTDASFTHGVCPVCMETTVRPELERFKRR